MNFGSSWPAIPVVTLQIQIEDLHQFSIASLRIKYSVKEIIFVKKERKQTCMFFL